jgi:MFS family permease
MSKNSPSNTQAKSKLLAWVVCITASLFFFYEFIQMNLFNAISEALIESFHMGAAGLGTMSSYYFIANVVFLFPAGMLLDRFSTKNVILSSLAVCIIGTFCFSFAQSIGWATFFRFLTGIGSAFCFLSVIRLATRWFPTKRLALITGIVVTIAMFGGVMAQKPLSMLVEVVSWRTALVIDGGVGIIIFILIALIVRDFPRGCQAQRQSELKTLHNLGYWKSMGKAFLRLHNWLGGIYTSTMNLPLSLLGGLWGVMYLEHVQGISASLAPEITMMLFVGTMVGSPISGWVSDRIDRRRLPMLTGAIISLCLVTVLLVVPGLSIISLFVLFFALGFFTSTQIIGYPVVAERSPPAITAMSVSVVNITTQGGIAIFQPVFGWLMDAHANSAHHSTPSTYLGSDFNWAMIIFPAGLIIALLAALFISKRSVCPKANAAQSNEHTDAVPAPSK